MKQVYIDKLTELKVSKYQSKFLSRGDIIIFLSVMNMQYPVHFQEMTSNSLKQWQLSCHHSSSVGWIFLCEYLFPLSFPQLVYLCLRKKDFFNRPVKDWSIFIDTNYRVVLLTAPSCCCSLLCEPTFIKCARLKMRAFGEICLMVKLSSLFSLTFYL